jgi:hypothetical protein
MNVVEDQHERLAAGGARVEQRRQHEVLDRRVRGAELIGQRGVEVQDRIERGEHRRDQGHRIVVGGLQGDPAERPLVALAPQCQQGRLAVAGRAGDQDDRDSRRRDQAIHQRGPIHDARPQRRHRQLAGDDAPAVAGRAEARRPSGILPLRATDRHGVNPMSRPCSGKPRPTGRSTG